MSDLCGRPSEMPRHRSFRVDSIVGAIYRKPTQNVPLDNRKINGKWLIVHEQLSVPVDLASGKAMMDLKP